MLKRIIVWVKVLYQRQLSDFVIKKMIVIREKTHERKKYYEKLISKDGKYFDLIDTVIYSLVKV